MDHDSEISDLYNGEIDSIRMNWSKKDALDRLEQAIDNFLAKKNLHRSSISGFKFEKALRYQHVPSVDFLDQKRSWVEITMELKHVVNGKTQFVYKPLRIRNKNIRREC